MSYDFSTLNDKEFEILACDLLSSKLCANVERFKPGKDMGVDGRYFTDSASENIIQCKHYLKSGYKALIRNLKNYETKKADKLKPNNYILVTSIPLSRVNKEEIQSIFHPYINSCADILGNEDLNDLLSSNPKIEEKHFKLWITSTNVYDRLINNAIKGRSEYEIDQIRINSKKYVETGNHAKALTILKENNVLIITGEPGVGKTTLANNLCLYFVVNGYEFINIEESLGEAENIYHKGKKQVFNFDDFLGSNYFEAIENKKDSHIVKFIERVKGSKNKRFILTSRTNILNTGVHHSSAFMNRNINKNEFLLSIKTLSELDRARILYNHIWFSDLSEKYIDELYKDKKYKEIINHKNFNPRLVEFITDCERIESILPDEYWNYIDSTFKDPKLVWSNCFKVQSNAYVRNLVKLVVYNGGEISEPELEYSYLRLDQLEARPNPSHTEKDFSSSSKQAVKSFLNRVCRTNRDKSKAYTTYSLFNPSISDYVLSEYANHTLSLENIYKSLRTVISLEHLVDIIKAGLINSNQYEKIIEILFDDAIKSNKDINYLISIMYLNVSNQAFHAQIFDSLNKLILNPIQTSQMVKLLHLLDEFYDKLKISSFDFILSCISKKTYSYDEIEALIEFVSSRKIENESINDLLASELTEYLYSTLSDSTGEVFMEDYIDTLDGEIICDTDGVICQLTDIMSNIVDDLPGDIIEKLGIDTDDLVNSIDIDDMVNDFIVHAAKSPRSGGASSTRFSQSSEGSDQVEDLFDRS